MSGSVFAEPEIRFQAKDLEYVEEIPDNRLRIVCPKCHRALYVCGVEEFLMVNSLENSQNQLNSCKPMLKSLPNNIIIGHPKIVCPYDQTTFIKDAEMHPVIGIQGSQYFTNKGWQPTRWRE